MHRPAAARGQNNRPGGAVSHRHHRVDVQPERPTTVASVRQIHTSTGISKTRRFQCSAVSEVSSPGCRIRFIVDEPGIGRAQRMDRVVRSRFVPVELDAIPPGSQSPYDALREDLHETSVADSAAAFFHILDILPPRVPFSDRHVKPHDFGDALVPCLRR